MTLFMTLFPIYLFGNLHCLGMCGPLVGWICHHPFRHLYFLGRLCSYSLVGLLAGEAGAVLHISLKQIYLGEILSLCGGLFILIWGIFQILRLPFPLIKNRSPRWNTYQQKMSSLLLKENAWSTFLFGFLTVALPCGQTIIVFSACALVGSASAGLFNGFAFALLTTPSLILAMQSFKLFKKFRKFDHLVLGGSSIVVGLLACCRGLAEGGWIAHWILNPRASPLYHLVVF